MSASRPTPAGVTFEFDPADRLKHSLAASRTIDPQAGNAWEKLRAGSSGAARRLEATNMCGLIVKCAVLTVLIQIFRALGRSAGPRFSGLALGLPSTTAVVLIFCGYEHGDSAATKMAESSLLGLVAAVSLPLAFTKAVQLGWPLWRAIGASVGGYVLLAATLGCLPEVGALPKAMIAGAALLGAARWVVRGARAEACVESGDRFSALRCSDVGLAYGDARCVRDSAGHLRAICGPKLGGTDEHVPQPVARGAGCHASGSRTGRVKPGGGSLAMWKFEHACVSGGFSTRLFGGGGRVGDACGLCCGHCGAGCD